MRYESIMKALLTNINQSLPMVPENYEHLAKQFDTEFHAYYDDRITGTAACGEADVVEKSPHELFHRPCFEAVMKAAKKLRDEKNFQHAYFLEGLQLISHVEDHCVQLANPEQHRMSLLQATTNRLVWQGANALTSMAVSLRPKSGEWMNPIDTWRKGTGAIITCVAVLRLRRNHPDELCFNDPNQEIHPLEFADRVMSRQAETAQIINDLYTLPPVKETT